MAIQAFGPFELDLASGELRRNGYLVDLQPALAILLVALATKAGEVVTRADLAERLWPGPTSITKTA